MTIEEFDVIWNLPKNKEVVADYGAVYDIEIDKCLYKHPASKLYMSPEVLIERSNHSIKRLEELAANTFITQQLYDHLHIYTVNDKKYHTLGRSFDIELVNGLGIICIIEDDTIHMRIFH